MSGPELLPRAQLDLAFARRGDRTVFDRRMFGWPFVLTRTFHLDTAPAHLLTVIVQTSGGAIHGEDSLNQHISVGTDAAVHVSNQGAAAVHRAHPGATTREAIRLRVAAGGFLEYLPEPRILFPDAAMNQTLDIDCEPGGTAIVADAFTVHDPAQLGRSFRALESTIILRQSGGEPVAIERMNIGGFAPGGLKRHSAFGTMFFVAARPAKLSEDLSLELSATLAGGEGLYAAASPLPGSVGIGVRLAAQNLRGLRAGVDLVRGALRKHLFGAAPHTLPR